MYASVKELYLFWLDFALFDMLKETNRPNAFRDEMNKFIRVYNDKHRPKRAIMAKIVSQYRHYAEWLPVEEPFFSEDAGDYEVHYSNNLDSGKVYVRILVPFAPGVDPSDLTFVRAKLTLDGSPFTGSLTHTLIDPEGESHSLDSTISATATDEYLLQVAFSVEDEADIDDIALVDIVYGLEGEMGSFVHTFTIPIAMDEETVSNRKQDPDTGGTKSDGGGGSGCDAGFGLFALFLAAIPMAARKRS